MQKLIYFNDLKHINSELENGWELIDVYSDEGLVLFEKKEQQIIRISPGSTAQDNKLKDLLNDGWKIKQMEGISSADDCTCYVWLEK